MPEWIITQTYDIIIRKTSLSYPLIEITCPFWFATSFYMQNDAGILGIRGTDTLCRRTEQGCQTYNLRLLLFVCEPFRIQIDDMPALVLGGKVVPQHTVTDLVAYLNIVGRCTCLNQRIYALYGVFTHFVCQYIGGRGLVHIPGLRYPLLGRISPCVAIEYIQQELHSGLLDTSAQLLHIFQILARTRVVV